MVRRLAPEFRAALACGGVALFAFSCENPNGDVATRTSALVGDPIESVQQVQGVAPVTINSVLSPPDGGSIDQTSFTIGLFEEDEETLCSYPGVSYCVRQDGSYATCRCSIMSDLNPEHPFILPYTAGFDDVSVVEVAVNVGAARAMQWEWNFNALYQRPFNEFWTEVVDQNGATTTIVDKVGPPAPWGFRFPHPSDPSFTVGERVDLDLTPWSNQRIAVRFILHNSYDPEFFTVTDAFGFTCCTGSFDMGTSKAYVSNLHVDTCAVQSVEFEELDSPLDQNPTLAGGGKRIFPDKRTPGDGKDRSRVRVVAHTNQPNCPVTLRSLDVANWSFDPAVARDLSTGEDNKPGGGNDCGLFIGDDCDIDLPSDASGTASAIFQVTKRPGDNFIIVAGTERTRVLGVTSLGSSIFDSGIPLPTGRLKITPMLTVWRRLHIERDSMGLVRANHHAGQVLRITERTPATVRLGLSGFLFPGRFENGRLVVGTTTLPVIRNDTSSILISNPGNSIVSALVGGSFLLYDDDDFNRNDGPSLHGDEGEDVPMPSTALLRDSDDPTENVFFDAFIRPTYDIGDNNNSVPFVLNTSSDEASYLRTLFRFDQVATEASVDFWTVYLLGGYQHVIGECNDPHDPNPDVDEIFGIVDEIGGQGAITFRETLTDSGETPTVNEASTAVHEIGHLFGLRHGELGVMGNRDGISHSVRFSPQSLAKLRIVPHP